MREILFRGFREDENGKDRVFYKGEYHNGTWVFGYYAFLKKRNDCFGQQVTGLDHDRYLIFSKHGDCWEVIPETVGQYTGLTDKNGKKIFEGDIVQTSQYGVDDGNGHNCAGKSSFEVVFTDGAFRLKQKWRCFNLVNGKHCEVIGNIHDNRTEIFQ